MGGIKKNTFGKIKLFRGLFTGLTHVYGTYDPISGRASQVKAMVTDKVILDHLMGRQPYGVYLLMKDLTRAIAADFDTENRMTPMEFTAQAKHYGINSYIERSKSKGYHVWMFFNGCGISARKARVVVGHILEDIEFPETEIFPKQDLLNSNARYGNFINAPLFGKLVPKDRTVFIDPTTFKPYPNQWDLLQSVRRVDESILDDIIEINEISPQLVHQAPSREPENSSLNQHGLPLCAQKMFRDGVTRFQRISTFRLAVHLKRLGLPFDVATAALKTWALKNRPEKGRGVITDLEIMNQISSAYKNGYRAYGCNSEAVAPFCHPGCLVNKPRIKQIDHNSQC